MTDENRWKLSRAISMFRVRVAFGINLNSCNTISFETGTLDRVYTRAASAAILSNVSFARRYRTFRACRDRNTRGAHARDQTVENNDEACCNACYYLHFLSRKDEHPRTQSWRVL